MSGSFWWTPGQTLTLLSPCFFASLSACQNNEGERNAAFRWPEWGQPTWYPHEYSALHMAPRIKICIHLKALIRTPHLNTSVSSCCQRPSQIWLVFLCLRRSEGLRLKTVDVSWKCWLTWTRTARSFYTRRRKIVMSNQVTDHGPWLYLGVMLAFKNAA